MSKFVAQMRLFKRLHCPSVRIRTFHNVHPLRHHKSPQLLIKYSKRNCSQSNVTSYGASFNSFGAPLKVLSISKETINFDPSSSEYSNKILVKTRASPIHPSDINIIEGVYARLPSQFPVTPGNEGLFEIVNKGNQVSKDCCSIGEFAVPSRGGIGTWREYLIINPSDIIPLGISSSALYQSTLLYQLAQITVNPCTAYRMINDFLLSNNTNNNDSSDWIVQNAANSAVGESVIQIAKKLNLKTINIIRGSKDGTDDRSKDEFNNISEYLYNLGANIVIGDIDYAKLNSEQRKSLIGDSKNNKLPKLGLNGVGGRSVADMIKILGYGGSIVTYGGMSKKPITVGTAPFIFNDVTLRGFWMTKWKEESEKNEEMRNEYLETINMVKTMIMNGEFKLSYKLVRFGENGSGLQYGIKRAMNIKDVNKLETQHEMASDESSENTNDSNDNRTPKKTTSNRGKVILVFGQ